MYVYIMQNGDVAYVFVSWLILINCSENRDHHRGCLQNIGMVEDFLFCVLDKHCKDVR